MQCPPTPVPGVNGVNPYGLVEAASMTSWTSTPRLALTSAISLASAMLTARKVFSYSFVSSAASGELTWWTSLVMWPTMAAARRVHSGVTPPITRGTDSWV